MTVVAAFLVLAVAASPSTPPRRTGDLSNSARARIGLLPRKPARTRAEVRGRRLLTIKAPAPTYLAEPAPIASDAGGEVEAVAAAEAAPVAHAAGGGGVELVAARGPVEVVALPSFDATEVAEAPARAIAPPEELDALRFAALGVETEVTLRMRFDP